MRGNVHDFPQIMRASCKKNLGHNPTSICLKDLLHILRYHTHSRVNYDNLRHLIIMLDTIRGGWGGSRARGFFLIEMKIKYFDMNGEWEKQ